MKHFVIVLCLLVLLFVAVVPVAAQGPGPAFSSIATSLKALCYMIFK